MRAWTRRNAEKVRAWAIRYRNENIEIVRAKDRARGYRNPPEQTKAHNAARTLKRQPCWCGATAEAHHPDYDKPLEVEWLCKKHHMEKHRTLD